MFTPSHLAVLLTLFRPYFDSERHCSCPHYTLLVVFVCKYVNVVSATQVCRPVNGKTEVCWTLLLLYDLCHRILVVILCVYIHI